jgi:hypothetical protein
MLDYDFTLQKKVKRGASPKASSPRASPPGGGAKRTLRKSRINPRKSRKTKTHKCIKRKTA